ncbi:hypothetical protein KX729_27780 [Rhizobium sp. XQZ8]|uniref:hypothetical protein n=1 Tax=Rhizobium populisoli TaxID=2859785 RepID=UPI001CA4F727|nr:hypothetical protein [Rhizobium populisoli]MBW6425235.1 hypothetical protein [Rhizobium populisoli]
MRVAATEKISSGRSFRMNVWVVSSGQHVVKFQKMKLLGGRPVWITIGASQKHLHLEMRDVFAVELSGIAIKLV